MKIDINIVSKNQCELIEEMYAVNDSGMQMSKIGFTTLGSRYCGHYVNTVTVGGVVTLPQYRREGLVRQMLNKMFDMAPERGWAVSFLHPFSFSYYRKFGYEKVADHKVVEFPIEKLEFIPRCTDLVPVESKETAVDCVKVYNKFASKRNIMFRRYGTSIYPTEPDQGAEKKTYIWYDKNGEPASYIMLGQEQYFSVNRMISVNLNIYEMAFTTKESLMALFGFIRMFEGDDNKVKIHNCAMAPEIDIILKHYMHTSYTIIPDIQARVLDVKKMLSLNLYPAERGMFTIKVEDTLPYTRGVYRVEYQNGQADVKKLADDAGYDLSAAMPSFTQLLYGYDEYDVYTAAFMDGVKIVNPNSDFFKVFHKKNNGVFEHF